MNLAEVHELSDAVLLAWYPGEEGGNAAADIIFGKVSPSGKLPITFPKSLDQLPPYEDYSMTGRTYRYMQGEPMYPFGYGLSYGKFEYSGLTLSANKINKNQQIDLALTLTNTGKFDAEEVAQLYLTGVNAKVETQPLYSLKDFKRVKLAGGASVQLKFTITPAMMKCIDNNGHSILEKGNYKIYVGGSCPQQRSLELGLAKPVEGLFTMK